MSLRASERAALATASFVLSVACSRAPATSQSVQGGGDEATLATRTTPATASASPSDAGNDPSAPIETDVGREARKTSGEDDTREPSGAASPASYEDVRAILFADRVSFVEVDRPCPPTVPLDARVRCLYDQRYRGDPKAASIAHELLVRFGIVAGVEVAHTMDGGYRGMVRLEPAVPTSSERRHLEWVSAAIHDFDTFFADLAHARAALTPRASTERATYRFRPLTLRFMRSVGVRTPAAYAHDWTIAYNLAGSINVSADAVRETMFHEVFHLNDAAHAVKTGERAGENWSNATLSEVFGFVVRKCGVRTSCLAPYAPGDTMVRGGTYYAFQPGNGVGEYAAELALRYYREQRASLRGAANGKARPFKCGPPENAKAWNAMKDEFFGGVDVTPPCPP
jgi:hypothetical protein